VLGTDRLRARPAYLCLCAVVFITFLDTTVVSVALADIQTRLHAGVSALQWIVNGYALAFASLMLAAGSLSDRIGRKRVLALGLALFSTGSLLALVAPSPGTLIAGRVVMGIGAAGCEPGTLSIIRQLYPDRAARARALGGWAAVCGLGLAAGPVIGGVLVGIGDWRLVFALSLATGLIALVATGRFVPESRDPQMGRFDYAGFLLGSGSIAALAIAVMVGETTSYSDAGVIALFALGLAGLGVFVLVESRTHLGLLDMTYMKIPAFAGSIAIAFVTFFGIFSIFFFTALYLQTVVGFAAYRTAVEFLPMTATLIASSLAAGRMLERFGPRVLVAGGGLCAGGGILWSDAILTHAGTPSLTLVVSLALAGAGFGFSIVPVTSVTLGVVPHERSGMAASVTNTSRELGAVFGVAILGALVNASLTADLAARLKQLGVPSAFQAIVIGAIETGSIPPGNPQTGATKAFGPIVGRVISAAYGAFRSGLATSLLVSGIAMLACALVALVVLGAAPRLLSLADSDAPAGGEGLARFEHDQADA
jgi:EmrB/QacA subfamily drug resistance transporter